jgi:BolA protein
MLTNTNIKTMITEKLSQLSPEILEVEDQRRRHKGHEGVGHYGLLIVSNAFSGLSLLERHRSIYKQLGELMGKEVHALQIKAYTPEEWASRQY